MKCCEYSAIRVTGSSGGCKWVDQFTKEMAVWIHEEAIMSIGTVVVGALCKAWWGNERLNMRSVWECTSLRCPHIKLNAL